MADPRCLLAAAAGGLAGLVLLGVAALDLLGPTASGLLETLGWIVPGLAVAAFLPASTWRPTPGDAVLGALAALLPTVFVTAGVAAACALGQGSWDPGGAGLTGSWTGNPAGAMAFEVSAPHTIGGLQAGMVLSASLWALPQGLGLAVWSRGWPRWTRPGALAALVGLALGLGQGPGTAMAGAAFAGLAAGLSGRSVWPTALGLGAILGLPALPPLLAAGEVGLGNLLVWGPAVAVAVGLCGRRLR